MADLFSEIRVGSGSSTTTSSSSELSSIFVISSEEQSEAKCPILKHLKHLSETVAALLVPDPVEALERPNQFGRLYCKQGPEKLG